MHGGQIYDLRGDNILHGRENNDQSGENIFDRENSMYWSMYWSQSIEQLNSS